MRCLYCGKELALLKRLTRGGEFCSEAHKQSYQEEYNRLGLSRLLQARSTSGESKSDQKPKAPQAAPVAVAEPPAEQAVSEKPARTAAPPPVISAPPVTSAPPVISAPPEPPPPAAAGFFFDLPPVVIGSEPAPYLEPSTGEDAPPAAPIWTLEGPAIEHAVFTLPSADLLPLEMQPGVCENGQVAIETNVAAKEFGRPAVNLSMPLNVTWTREFQAGGSVAIEIVPRPSESNCYASLNGALDFSYPAFVQSFGLMELSPSGIAYPAEDCDVTFPESWTNGMIPEVPETIPAPQVIPEPVATASPLPQVTAPSKPPAQPVAAAAIPSAAPPTEVAPTKSATPRAALQALSKLHQDMREREEAVPPEPPAEAIQETAAAPPVAAEPAEPMPREANELLAMSLKSFAPPKASPAVDTNALLANEHPLLPRLKALPLRPKVAPAPRGFGQTKTAPPPKPAAEAKAAADGKAPVEPKVPVELKPKPAQSVTTAATEASSKPPAATNKPTPQAQNLKPAPTVEKKMAEPPQVKTPTQEPKKQAAPEAPKAKPVAPPPPVSSAPSPASPRVEQVTKPVTVKSAPVAPQGKPAQSSKAEPAPALKAEPAPPSKPEPARSAGTPAKTEPAQKPAPKSEPLAKPAAAASAGEPSTDHTVPNFGAVVNTSMFGSMKVKVGIAALGAVMAVGGYFMFASKSKTVSTVNKATDGVGPSIMVGEGGWVEGWAGDPTGLHGGRQITIYRPSLKLTNYRIEFQGQIETKSLGWVFRAADPENYYAMKLELVSPELPLTVVLYKYMVLKGRQVQVGRVPIEVPVKNDTVFNIRVDVRGPKFSTYVQGQPVDVWTDDQLKVGGAGFLNERGERGKIKSVSLSYLSGGTK